MKCEIVNMHLEGTAGMTEVLGEQAVLLSADQ